MKFAERIPTLLRWARWLGRAGSSTLRFLGNFLFRAVTKTWRFFRRGRWIKPLVFGGVCLVTLVALVIAEENYRGARDWENYRRDAEARGVKFSLDDFAQPPVPDDQNFAAAPIIKEIEAGNFSEWPRSDDDDLIDALYRWENERDVQWQHSQPADVATMVKDLKKSFKKTLDENEVRRELQRYEPVLSEITAASLRPYAHFPLPQEFTHTDMRNYATLRNAARLLGFRALLELNDGQSDLALADTATIFRLSDALREKPTLITQLFRPVMDKPALLAVWEGLRAKRWSEPQLAALQQQLADADLLPGLKYGLDTERAWMTDFLQLGVNDPAAWDKLIFPAEPKGFVLGARLFPGLFYQNLLYRNEYEDKYMDPAINVAAHRFYPVIVKQGEDLQHQNYSEYNPYTRLTFFIGSNIFIPFAQIQIELDETVTACALERYRLAQGRYPDSLDALVPQYLAKVPTSVLTGEPLKYQLTPDGQFILYAAGWNHVDQNDPIDASHGYVVWQYPSR